MSSTQTSSFGIFAKLFKRYELEHSYSNIMYAQTPVNYTVNRRQSVLKELSIKKECKSIKWRAGTFLFL